VAELFNFARTEKRLTLFRVMTECCKQITMPSDLASEFPEYYSPGVIVPTKKCGAATLMDIPDTL
jgi:hypothetical protein